MKKIFAFIESIKIWIKEILSVSKNHFLSIVFILLVYVLLWHVPQIKDLLVIINQEENHFIQMGLFFSSLTVLAFLISSLNNFLESTKQKEKNERSLYAIKNFSGTYQDKKQQHLTKAKVLADSFKESQREYIERLFPKVLGTLLIVIVAFAINHTFYNLTNRHIIFGYQIFNSKFSIGFYLALFLLLMILQQKVAIAIGKFFSKFDKHNNLPIILGVVCFFVIIGLGFLNKKGTDGDIKHLFYAVLLLAILFFLITTSYHRLILKYKSKIGTKIILLFIVVVFVSYITFLFKPQVTTYINPLSIVFINLITFFTVISALRLIGKILGISLLTRVFVILFLMGSYTASKDNFTHYEVSRVKIDKTITKRLSLNNYIEIWLEERTADIVKSKKFPVIFVSSEGGGSRAGLWSFLVHSYLYQKDTNYFNKNLFSLTGASGGGVGNAVFYTSVNQSLKNNKKIDLLNKLKNKDSIFKYKASVFYKGNYISSSIAALLGRDFIKSIIDIGAFDDRGALVENEWEKNYKKVFKSNYIGKEYLSIMPQNSDYKKVMPLLLMNTTHLQTGNRFIISPVTFNNNAYLKGFQDFLTAYKNKENDSTMIKISTSMLLNARFPYLSPAGKVKDVGQFGDAGYYDNIGGAVTRNLEKAFNEVLKRKKYDMLREKIEIRHLVIAHKEIEKDTVFNGTQLVAPIQMMLNATFAHPAELKERHKEFLVESKITEIIINDELIEPILPLGRILSNNAILSLEERLFNKDVKDKLDQLLIHE